jgi:hypothetical protein
MMTKPFRNADRARAAVGRGSDSAMKEMNRRDRTKPQLTQQPVQAPSDKKRDGATAGQQRRDGQTPPPSTDKERGA